MAKNTKKLKTTGYVLKDWRKKNMIYETCFIIIIVYLMILKPMFWIIDKWLEA